MASSTSRDGLDHVIEPLAQSPARQTRSLLPPADILSSSPLPRPNKRKHADSPLDPTKTVKYYPTPVPTSSTHVLSSSPSSSSRRPPLQRTASALSERAPLCSVPTADIPSNGEPLLLGRSSNSSNYQFPANRLISRVHIRATFQQPDSKHASCYVRVECLGWNGAKVHCLGKVVPLTKGDTFESSNPHAEIMLDVQETRVILAWPAGGMRRSGSVQSERTWTETSPVALGARGQNRVASSPPPLAPRSPVSPSPGGLQPIVNASQSFIADVGPVQVYEDPSSDSESAEAVMIGTTSQAALDRSSRLLSTFDQSNISQASFQSKDDYSDHDEENDPIVHSFGPSGENILPRFQLVTATSPNVLRRARQPLRASNSPPKARSFEQPQSDSASGLGIEVMEDDAIARAAITFNSEIPSGMNVSPIKNHVINQLAFSRVHAVPLSTIFGNLPKELKVNNEDSSEIGLSSPVLKTILEDIPCVGEIAREGKDAAGKQLENEYYYVPEMDANTTRKEAVVGSRGGGLRAVRRNHKQYFWKRPRV